MTHCPRRLKSLSFWELASYGRSMQRRWAYNRLPLVDNRISVVVCCAHFDSANRDTRSRTEPQAAEFSKDFRARRKIKSAVETISKDHKQRNRTTVREDLREAVARLNWPPLLSRKWEPVVANEAQESRRHSIGKSSLHDAGENPARLKVLQWNTLADGLSGCNTEKGGFINAPEGSLDWDKRRWKILEEILSWNCDVITLQEVDHHHDWLSPMMERAGYRGIFAKKPSSPAMTFFNPFLEDGCSIFYRVDGSAESGTAGETTRTLELIDSHSFTFAVEEEEERKERVRSRDVLLKVDRKRARMAAMKQPKVSANERKTLQNEVAIIALFRICEGADTQARSNQSGNGSLVIVATTHLHALKSEDGERTRELQAEQLLGEVERIRAGHERGRDIAVGSLPVIIAGDFNAASSPIEDIFAEGATYEPTCFRTLQRSALGLTSAFPPGSTVTTWKLRPANTEAARAEARRILGNRLVPKVSSVKADPAPSGKQGYTDMGDLEMVESKSCIDYVWMSRGIRAERISSSPTSEDLGPPRAPSFVYPSDHFALAVDLKMPA